MADLRDLLEQAAGAEPPPLPVALVRGQAAIRRRRRRRNRIVIGLAAAAAVVVAAVVASRPTAPRPDPADSHRVRKVTIGPLLSGRYTGLVGDTPVTFTIPGRGQWMASRVTSVDLTLTEQGFPFQIEVTHWASVNTYDARGVALRRTRPVPADLVQWLQRHPALETVGPVVPTRLAGRPAHQLEVVVRAGYEPRTAPPQAAPNPCALLADCVTLGTTTDGPMFLHRRTILILVVTDAPAEQRLAAMAWIPVRDDARPATRAAEEVLTSLSPAP